MRLSKKKIPPQSHKSQNPHNNHPHNDQLKFLLVVQSSTTAADVATPHPSVGFDIPTDEGPVWTFRPTAVTAHVGHYFLPRIMLMGLLLLSGKHSRKDVGHGFQVQHEQVFVGLVRPGWCWLGLVRLFVHFQLPRPSSWEQ